MASPLIRYTGLCSPAVQRNGARCLAVTPASPVSCVAHNTFYIVVTPSAKPACRSLDSPRDTTLGFFVWRRARFARHAWISLCGSGLQPQATVSSASTAVVSAGSSRLPSLNRSKRDWVSRFPYKNILVSRMALVSVCTRSYVFLRANGRNRRSCRPWLVREGLVHGDLYIQTADAGRRGVLQAIIRFCDPIPRAEVGSPSPPRFPVPVNTHRSSSRGRVRG